MAPKNAVISPIQQKILKRLKYIKIKWNFNKRKNPEAIRVAECINADAGTGASIESGNQ